MLLVVAAAGTIGFLIGYAVAYIRGHKSGFESGSYQTTKRIISIMDKVGSFTSYCEPTNGRTYQKPKEKRNVYSLSGHTGSLCDEDRSLISPDYARNFICDFVIGKKTEYSEQTLFD